MTELNRDRIDHQIAKDINEIIGHRVRGREQAFQTGLATLCLSLASVLHQFGDDKSYAATLGLLSDLYFNGWRTRRQKRPDKRRLH